MSIEMVRIDDRLIHGQIVAAWVKRLGINRIWIIDDGVAKDEFLKNVITMVAPSGIKLIFLAFSLLSSLLSKHISLNFCSFLFSSLFNCIFPFSTLIYNPLFLDEML